MSKQEALAKLFNVSVNDIRVWSDGSLTFEGYEYDTKQGIGAYVGKVGRYKFYKGSRV